MVEVRGIEPLSESISAAVSPSAADVLEFALPAARQQAEGFAIP